MDAFKQRLHTAFSKLGTVLKVLVVILALILTYLIVKLFIYVFLPVFAWIFSLLLVAFLIWTLTGTKADHETDRAIDEMKTYMDLHPVAKNPANDTAYTTKAKFVFVFPNGEAWWSENRNAGVYPRDNGVKCLTTDEYERL